LATPAAPTATAVGTNKINVTWAYTDTTVSGFKLGRCSGAGCTNFAQVGTNIAGNLRAYSDTGLAVNTSYSYRIQAVKGADTSAWSPSVTKVTGSGGTGGTSITLIGAGEITSCASVGSSQTATLVQNQLTADPSTIVFSVGNNLADTTTANRSYATCFDPNWGKFKSKMHVALGNMDFKSTSTAAPYDYFGTAIGSPKGYYSFDAGSWHIIVLNTTSEQFGVCDWSDDATAAGPQCGGKPHPQLEWLAADLAANTKPCLMAISWERRLYTSGTGTLGRNTNLNAAAEMLYGAGLDILVSAKDKQYERFPKLNVDGAADPKGFAQFIVGTGGRSLDHMTAAASGNPVAAQFGGAGSGGAPDSWGVIKFTLNDNSYGWEFVGTDAARFSDKSTAPVACN